MAGENAVDIRIALFDASAAILLVLLALFLIVYDVEGEIECFLLQGLGGEKLLLRAGLIIDEYRFF